MEGMKLENFNKTLRIKKIAMNDGGDYICTATNKMGSVDHIITVKVKCKFASQYYLKLNDEPAITVSIVFSFLILSCSYFT